MESIAGEAVRQGLLCLLEETLNSHQGVYLEPGTSWIESLKDLDSTVASRPYEGLSETIAGHVHHARYYLSNTLALLRGQGNGDFDVVESWKVSWVSPLEWDTLRTELRDAYGDVMGLVSRASTEQLEAALPAVLGMIAHSAYHLGAIRQLKDLPLVR